MSNTELFTQKFDSDTFAKYCRDNLTDSFQTDKEELDNINPELFQSITKIGFSPDLEGLVVIKIKLAKANVSKITLTKNVFRLLAWFGINKALVAFYNPDQSTWRLSLISQSYIINQKGKFQRQYSNAKRYSYQLGEGVQVQKTAKKYLSEKFGSWEDLLNRFSVTTLSNDFYKEIKGQYEKMYSEIKLPGNNLEDSRKDFCLRLVGRLIFCWFLKAKGWIGRDVLSVNSLEQNQNYYHGFLEPLFFDTLNKDNKERTSDIKDLLTNVPYLNGGLFEPKDEDCFNSADGKDFEDQINWQLDVPDANLKSLLELFEEYHFTVDESTPDDQEVGIDPEMMGRIFENFILERSSTGSFYTPRPIVDYMVGSSLRESLTSRFDIIPQTKEQILNWYNLPIIELQAQISLKPNLKVILKIPNNPEFGYNIVISAYLIAKLRGQLFSVKDKTRQFMDCSSHAEIDDTIWTDFLDGRFELCSRFVPNPNQATLAGNNYTIPKIGFVIKIQDQKFVLFFSILLSGNLQLDTFYKAYKESKITKLCNAKSEDALVVLTHYLVSKNVNQSKIQNILSIYIRPKKKLAKC
jgi:hypothetical protein